MIDEEAQKVELEGMVFSKTVGEFDASYKVTVAVTGATSGFVLVHTEVDSADGDRKVPKVLHRQPFSGGTGVVEVPTSIESPIVVSAEGELGDGPGMGQSAAMTLTGDVSVAIKLEPLPEIPEGELPLPSAPISE